MKTIHHSVKHKKSLQILTKYDFYRVITDQTLQILRDTLESADTFAYINIAFKTYVSVTSISLYLFHIFSSRPLVFIFSSMPFRLHFLDLLHLLLLFGFHSLFRSCFVRNVIFSLFSIFFNIFQYFPEKTNLRSYTVLCALLKCHTFFFLFTLFIVPSDNTPFNISLAFLPFILSKFGLFFCLIHGLVGQKQILFYITTAFSPFQGIFEHYYITVFCK